MLCLAAAAKSGTADDVNVLIPFLGYGTGGAYVVINITGEKDLSVIKSTYPAFAAIMANPAAKSVLSNYCLNQKNRIPDRINAFLVLRYVDPAEFKRITPTINDSFKGDSADLKKILNGVENYQIPFVGEVWVQK
jgi:hypothetical protein